MTAATTSKAGLWDTGLCAGYGRVQVVNDFTVAVEPGEIIALVGRNGAGKSTALSAVCGLRFGKPGGTVYVDGADMSQAPADALVRAGVSLVPEGRRIFRDMTVIENLRLGAFTRRRSGRREIPADFERVCELFPALARYSGKRAGELSGGQQQMVAIGQALMSRPKYLLLDEPASGVAPVLVDEIYDTVEALVTRDRIGLLMVDQSIERAIERSHRIYVMDSGSIVMESASASASIERINPIVMGTAGQESPTPESPVHSGT
jgi:branched-chain amino acid transport system ATP-binding protein